MSKKIGNVIWLTGLSGAGKSTLAHALLPSLTNTIFLDGDTLRSIFGTVYDLGFDENTRKKLGYAYANLCQTLAAQGFNVLIATICMYHTVHENNRKVITNYHEIFIDVSYETRLKRDPKGLYKAQLSGTINNMTGVDAKAELPLNPHIIIHENESIEQACQKILFYLKDKEWVF